jgi:NADH-quinone oxidoreductase subunit D
LGVIGPTARASGLVRDLRVDDPDSHYADFPINIVLETNGDLEARFKVRVRELFESYRIIREILENMPPGELKVKRMPRRIKAGEAISRVEAPRGELFYYIKSNGSDKPARIKVRTPTLCNMASVLTLTVGHQLADVPMIVVGIDPCFSCNDRSVVVKQSDGSQVHWSWERVRQYGIDYYQSKMR